MIPVGTVEICQRLQVTRAAVHSWRTRKLGFPEPRWIVGGRPCWDWTDVETWCTVTGHPRKEGK